MIIDQLTVYLSTICQKIADSDFKLLKMQIADVHNTYNKAL